MKKIFILTIMILAVSFSAFAQTKSSHKITEVKAYLMYEENGELSKNILDTDFALWNVIIGEGDAEGHSSSTLIKVVVANDGKETKTNPVIQFTAISSDGKRVNYKKTFEYQFPTEAPSKTYIPFLLHDTGCQKISMTIKLVDRVKSTIVYQTVKKEIPFNCGE